ncbi:helix-turn-helix transcriptional regulator [Shewanella sp. MF05960]|uniref:helix-turn-helix transcriptional regulator n=1 Tax=Shewanella sp. MF05960 TaxID=3434874 RepID=UPI003D79E6AF
MFLQSEKLVDFKYVKQMTSLSRTRIWQLEKAGQFPRGRRLTQRCCRWLESEVQAWVRGEWEGV